MQRQALCRVDCIPTRRPVQQQSLLASTLGSSANRQAKSGCTPERSDCKPDSSGCNCGNGSEKKGSITGSGKTDRTTNRASRTLAKSASRQAKSGCTPERSDYKLDSSGCNCDESEKRELISCKRDRTTTR